MKLNHFICPNCGHDFYAEGASVKCDACQRFPYASESLTSKSTCLVFPTIGTQLRFSNNTFYWGPI